jgi:hypothetical protein
MKLSNFTCRAAVCLLLGNGYLAQARTDTICTRLFSQSDDTQEFAAGIDGLKEYSITATVQRRDEIQAYLLQGNFGWGDNVLLTSQLSVGEQDRVKELLTKYPYNQFEPSLSFADNFLKLCDSDQVVKSYIVRERATNETYQYLSHEPGDNEDGLVFRIMPGYHEVVAKTHDGECNSVN